MSRLYKDMSFLSNVSPHQTATSQDLSLHNHSNILYPQSSTIFNMMFSSVISLATCLALIQAAPLTARTGSGVIVFHGAADAQYTLTVPLDGTDTPTKNALSISSVSSDTINVKDQCILKTVDYPPALVEGPKNTWVVGPPQTVTSISCTGGSPPPPPPSSITIEFDGADPSQGAKYTLTVPLDGKPVTTSMYPTAS